MDLSLALATNSMGFGSGHNDPSIAMITNATGFSTTRHNHDGYGSQTSSNNRNRGTTGLRGTTGPCGYRGSSQYTDSCGNYHDDRNKKDLYDAHIAALNMAKRTIPSESLEKFTQESCAS